MGGSDVVGPLIRRFNTMPMFVLVAKLCPPGVEATLFALNMGLSNFGYTMGTYLGIGLLGVMGGVEAPRFDNLKSFLVLRSLMRLLPILMLPLLVPPGSPSDGETAPTNSGPSSKDVQYQQPYES